MLIEVSENHHAFVMLAIFIAATQNETLDADTNIVLTTITAQMKGQHRPHETPGFELIPDSYNLELTGRERSVLLAWLNKKISELLTSKDPAAKYDIRFYQEWVDLIQPTLTMI